MRKAGSIGRRASVGAWLYRVAYRVALRARAAKRAFSPLPDDLPAPDAAPDVLWRDLRPVLDEEVNRLPAHYRVPFVLCHLEGKTNAEIADDLVISIKTVDRHRENIMQKLNLHSRIDLVKYALRKGLITLEE